MHPFAVERSESGLRRRVTGLPLTTSPDLSEIWMCEISIGTPPKTLKGKLSRIILIMFNLIYITVQIDTGSAYVLSFISYSWFCSSQHSDMWVLQTGCDGISTDRNLWDPRLSKTSKYQGGRFQLRYEDGTIIQGGQYTDNVTIGGFTVCFVSLMTMTMIEF
jgi:hypothetical protein